jgi:hypothetical protein
LHRPHSRGRIYLAPTNNRVALNEKVLWKVAPLEIGRGAKKIILPAFNLAPSAKKSCI